MLDRLLVEWFVLVGVSVVFVAYDLIVQTLRAGAPMSHQSVLPDGLRAHGVLGELV